MVYMNEYKYVNLELIYDVTIYTFSVLLINISWIFLKLQFINW